jgi:hypothetical protein
MTFQDLGMQMSFGDIMCKFCNFLILFLMAPFSFQEGRKVFNGAIGCNFYFFYSPVQYKGQIRPHVKCKDLGLHHTIECKKYEEAPKSSLRGCRA